MNLQINDNAAAVGIALVIAAGCVLGGACSSSSPPPKDALDFGQSLAVALCQAEAPKRGFNAGLCEPGSEFLREFVENAAKVVATNALADRGPVAASVPCPPFVDGPAPVVPGTSGGTGAQ